MPSADTVKPGHDVNHTFRVLNIDTLLPSSKGSDNCVSHLHGHAHRHLVPSGTGSSKCPGQPFCFWLVIRTICMCEYTVCVDGS